jgi:hypothetical protein
MQYCPFKWLSSQAAGLQNYKITDIFTIHFVAFYGIINLQIFRTISGSLSALNSRPDVSDDRKFAE